MSTSAALFPKKSTFLPLVSVRLVLLPLGILELRLLSQPFPFARLSQSTMPYCQRTPIATAFATLPTRIYRNRFRHTADAHLSQSLLPHRRCALIVIAFSTLPTRTYRPTYAAPTPFSGHVRYFLNHSVSLKRISLLEQLTVTSPPSEETTILPFIASKPPSAVSE